jgi:hypothetical protein
MSRNHGARSMGVLLGAILGLSALAGCTATSSSRPKQAGAAASKLEAEEISTTGTSGSGVTEV